MLKTKRVRGTLGVRGSHAPGARAFRRHLPSNQMQEDSQATPGVEHMAAALILGAEHAVTLLATGAHVVQSALLPPRRGISPAHQARSGSTDQVLTSTHRNWEDIPEYPDYSEIVQFGDDSDAEGRLT